MKRLFEKFTEAFNKYNNSLKPISFYILILETQTLLYREGRENDNYKTEPIFNIDFSIWKNLKAGKYYFNNMVICNDEKEDFDWQILKFEIKK